MITPDIHDESLWVPQFHKASTPARDPNPLSASGTPYEYEERPLPSTTDGIDWISPRDDYDFMCGSR